MSGAVDISPSGARGGSDRAGALLVWGGLLALGVALGEGTRELCWTTSTSVIKRDRRGSISGTGLAQTGPGFKGRAEASWAKAGTETVRLMSSSASICRLSISVSFQFEVEWIGHAWLRGPGTKVLIRPQPEGG